MAALAASLLMTAFVADAQYVNGYFIIAEGQYGVEPGLLNFYSAATGELNANILQADEGSPLGMTAQFAALADGKLFITSKQNFGSTGGRLTVLDASSLQPIAVHALIDGEADTRGVAVAPDAGKFYVGTNIGLYVYDLNTMEQIGKIEGSGSEDSMYSPGMGDMLVRGSKLYVATPAGVMVVDTESDQLISTIALENVTTVFEVQGRLYAAVNSCTWGTPSDSDTEQFVAITDDDSLGETYDVPAASLYPWFTPKPCAPAPVKGENAVVYCSGEGLKYLSKYNFDSQQYTEKFIQFDGKQQMYGHVVATDPESGDILACTFQGYSSTNYWFNIYDGSTGELKKSVKMPGHYWFPSQIVRSLWTAQGLPGDVNGDGAVDVGDVVAMANHVMGETPAEFLPERANVNADLSVDVSDVVALAGMVMGN